MSIIFVHELGHLAAARYYGWNTDKIYIYPLGGITKFNESINKPLKEELVIVLMGPIFQLVYYVFLLCVGIKDIYLFNFVLLAFNLLPIYPLDGGKILNVFLAYFLPYKFSYSFTLTISCICYFLFLIFLFLFYRSYFLFLVCFSLIFKIVEEYKKRNYYFNKFLLERYLYYYRYKKIKYIKRIDDMYRNKTHFFLFNGLVFTEKDMLKKYFR